MWIARMAIRERKMALAKPVRVVWLNEGQQERQRQREGRLVHYAIDSVPVPACGPRVQCVERSRRPGFLSTPSPSGSLVQVTITAALPCYLAL